MNPDFPEKCPPPNNLSSVGKNVLSNFLRWGLSVILLAYLYHIVDIDKTFAIIKSADIQFIIYAFIIFIFIEFLMFMRWYVFIEALELRVPFMILLRYFFIGLFGNLFLPSSVGGDVIKIWGICQHTAEKPKVIASVILDRLSGFAGIVIVATVAFTISYRTINDFSLLIAIAMMFIASLVIAVILFNETLYTFCCRIFTLFPKIKSMLMNIHYDIVLLKDKRPALYKSIGISCLCQIVSSVIFFFIAEALHQDVPLVYWLIFFPLICVASALPSIGGLGIREAATAFLLAKVGVDYGIGVSISLMSFIFMVLMGLVGGAFYLFTKEPQKLSSLPRNSVSTQNHTV